MSCSCKKLNGYIVSKCGYHYDKRKTIFQLYKKVRLELAALKAKELDTAHNTGSPKLPLFEEIWNTLKHELYNPSDNLGGVEYLIKGQAERVYEFIERQLRAGA